MARQKPVPTHEPSGEFRNPGEPVTVEVDRDAPVGEALYWFGALPAEGKHKITIPEDGKDLSLDDVSELYQGVGELTAFQAWFPHTWIKNKTILQDFPSRWMGRCEWFQNLGVTGMEFPAFTQEVMPDPMNSRQTMYVPWPGSVGRFTDLDIERILESVKNHAIRRMTNGMAETVNYAFAHLEGCRGGLACTCLEIERGFTDAVKLHGDHRILKTARRIRQRGDMPMADFVYLRRLTADVETSHSEYGSLVPGFESFLKNPPPSLSASMEEKAAPAA